MTIKEIIESCKGCKAWSGTDCTRNIYTQGCLKDSYKNSNKNDRKKKND